MLAPGRTTTVLSIPGGHPYVRAVVPDSVRVLPDPTDPWWPHPALDPGHLRRLDGAVDLVHLHFGFEHRSVAEIEAWRDTLAERRLPLVLTVHDLENPNLHDGRHHLAQLDVLVPAAAALVTLTGCAASAIGRRWGRRPVVVPHPPLLAPATGLPPTEAGLVGVHLKRLRPNVTPVDVLVPALGEAVAAHGARLEVRIDPIAGAGAVARVRELAAPSMARVVVAGRLDERDFAAELARLEVAVLPYRFGTHSGWLEACRDVGTRVVAPHCGCFTDQWSEVVPYAGDRHGLDRASLAEAVGRALALGSPPPPDPVGSDRRRREAAAAHARIYADVLAAQ